MSGDPTTELTTTRHEAVVEYLEGEGVSYTLVEHESTMTAAAEAAAAHTPPADVGKTIVLSDGRRYVMVAIPASRRLDLHQVRNLVDASKQLQLASEDAIAAACPALEVGAVPPFGPLGPATEVIDRTLVARPRVLWPGGDHHHSVLVDPREVIRLTGAAVADICED